MGFFDSVNGFLKGAGNVVEDFSQKSAIYLEETRIWSRAQEFIKTDNFSSDLERTVMLAAAEREGERKRDLAAKLASDPVLSKFFSEALARIQAVKALDTVRSVRLADEAAMNAAVRQRLLHARLGT